MKSAKRKTNPRRQRQRKQERETKARPLKNAPFLLSSLFLAFPPRHRFQVENPFRYRREPTSLEAAAASLSKTAATAVAGVALLGAAAAGGLAGRAVAPPQAKAAVAAVGAVASAAAAAAGVKAAEGARVRGAGAILANKLVDMDDPATLTREDMLAVEEATGVDFNARLVDELKAAYDTFLSSSIPAGELVGEF